jgi:hypothetical protein
VRDAQGKVDSAQRTLADVKRATDSAKATVPEAARKEIAALEKELTEVTAQIGGGGRGGRGGGAGAFGGGGGGAGGGGAGGGGAGAVGGGRGGGRGGRGGGAGAAAVVPPPVVVDSTPPEPATPSTRTIQARLGTMTEIMNVLFAPSPEQLKTLKGFPAELQLQVDRITKVRANRLPALLEALKAAGIEVKPNN